MTWTRRIASLATLPAVVALLACQGEQQPQQEAMEEPAAQQEVAQPAYEIEVVNPMPHAMIVTAQTGTEEAIELGAVEPMGTTTFTITAPASMNVTLSAADEAETHRVQGEVALAADSVPSWTIGK